MKAESATAKGWQKTSKPKPITHEIRHGDCLTELRKLADKSVDAIVTDPPAGISFMGKSWDDDKGGRDQWIKWLSGVFLEAWRVLKPGGHCLVWALPRTSHWTATAVENAGFEVRDVVTHLFGSGFPKSMDVSKAIDKAAGAKRPVVGKLKAPASTNRVETMGRPEQSGSGWQAEPMETSPSTHAAKQWDGFGTALKPSSEHWILARRPLSENTVADNVRRWGVGAINVDGGRVGDEERFSAPAKPGLSQSGADSFNHSSGDYAGKTVKGRWPANTVFTEGEATDKLDEQQAGASRFFYVAKPSKSERNKGLDEMPTRIMARSGGAQSALARGETYDNGDGSFNKTIETKNHHPTVKPIKLMTYLIGLVTAPGQTVLDMFAGSGTTLLAAKECGRSAIGIEREAEYVEIIKTRLNR